MKKKLYISLPISGRNLDDVKKRAILIKRSIISKEYKGVTPFDICPDSTLPYPELMGRDIAALMECDAVLFDYDWSESKGCRAEMAFAEIYGKRIFHIKDERMVEDPDKRLFSITLNKRQLEALSDACDNHSRNICGQLDVGLQMIIEKALRKTFPTAKFNALHDISNKVESLLREIKALVWDLGPGTNMGLHYDANADILYDIHQVIRHHLWKLRPQPKCDYTNDAFRAMKFGKEPLITIKTLSENGE